MRELFFRPYFQYHSQKYVSGHQHQCHGHILLLEELFFRGILLRGMKKFGTVAAVFYGAALFSLYHQSPAQTAYQFICDHWLYCTMIRLSCQCKRALFCRWTTIRGRGKCALPAPSPPPSRSVSIVGQLWISPRWSWR